MSRGLKIIGYVFFGIVSFVIFLYFTFPFEVLKDRLLANVEKELKGKYEIQVGSVSPSLIAGVSMKNVKIIERGESANTVVFEASKVKVKATVFSLIVGSPTIKFDVRSGKGRIYGRAENEKDLFRVKLNIDDFDVSKISFLSAKYGLNMKSEINAEADLSINPKQIIRSSGTFKIIPGTINILASKIKTQAMGEMDLPAMVIGGGKSLIEAELKRGAVRITSMKLDKGDLQLDLTGSVYLSTNIQNYRLNLKGDFGFTEKVEQALPFLFIIEKQKKENGRFPLTISGRVSKPQIKIGDFTLPL